MVYKPILITGYAHGGLTLLANMLKKHPDIFPLRYNNDELHNYKWNELPIPLRNPGGKGGSCWKYGLDPSIGSQHFTEEDATPQMSRAYQGLLTKIYKNDIKNYTKHPLSRLVDKSQPYMTRTRLVQELVRPDELSIIYQTRNPYVLCYKPLKFNWYRHKHIKNDEDRIRMACQHVSNTHRILMEDKKHLDHYYELKFEDLIIDPRSHLLAVSKFLGIEFVEDMIPHPPHKQKWYPLNPTMIWQHDDIRRDDYDDIIEDKCADMIKQYDYKRKPKRESNPQ